MDDVVWTPRSDSRYDRAPWMSKFVFDWVRIPLWSSYNGRQLDLDDAPIKLKARTLRNTMESHLTNSGGQQYLLLKFCRNFIYEVMIASLIAFLRFCAFMLIQVYFLGILIASLYTNGDDEPWSHRYVPAAVIMVMALLSSFCLPHIYYLSECFGAKIRVATSTLVYEKMLRIRTAEMKRIHIGQVINLFASDVGKIDEFGRLLGLRLLDPLALIATLAFLQLCVGLSGIIGYIVLISIGISTICLSKVFKKIGREKATLTDKRLKLTTDMISEARTMKMFCWEEVYCKSIEEIRKKELFFCFFKYCCKAFIGLLQSIPSRISMYIAISFMLVMRQTINPSKVYMSFAIFNNTQITLVILLAKLFESGAYALVAFERIQKTMDIDEMTIATANENLGPPTIESVTSSWYPSENLNDTKAFVLKFINLSFPTAAVTMITGPVGSGKSTLLLTMVNEVFIHSGKVSLGGSVTYMPQEPWLFPSTIRQNILFGLPYDEQRYQNVLSSCALEQDIAILSKGDFTNVDDKGLTLSGGQKARISLARAMYRHSEVYLLDDPLSAVDVRVGRHIWKQCLLASDKTIILVSHCIHLLDDTNYIVHLDKGKTTFGPYGQLKNRFQLEYYNKEADHYVDTIDVDGENKNPSHSLSEKTKIDLGPNPLEKEMKESPLLVWCRMAWSCANGYGPIILVLSLGAIAQTFGTSFDILVSRWVYSQGSHFLNISSTYNHWSFLYLGAFILAEIIGQMTFYLILFGLTIRSAKRLHENMLRSITRAKMEFFDSHSTGQIINRFSKDVELVDDFIPPSAGQAIRLAFILLGGLANAAYSNVFVMVPIAFFLIVIGWFISIFIKSVKSLKEMEASARSPIYSYMNCSLNGAAVIRTHENQDKVKIEFDARQDQHSAIWFIMKGMSYWMGLLCEITVFLLITSIILLTLLLPNYTNSSRLGVGISSTIVLGSVLQVLTRDVVEVDGMIISIKRIREYIKLSPEEGYLISNSPPPPQWPALGRIKLQNLNLCYGHESKCVLKDISFEVYPGEKIGIVGRTGAGKSSIVAALFRMTETQGLIEIDGVDINTLQIVDYRKTLSIIPQNPVILSGSIRRNLDPSSEFTDEQLWGVLEDVQLKVVVKNLENGLEDGMNHFSVGQKQLFCLARTLLYNKKIIILDEATSNIDNKTDKIMQDLIRTKLANSTLLVIAHRLQTVLDLDRIMVLHDGKIVEFDDPTVLLNNPNSTFRRMVLNANIDSRNFEH